MADFKNTKEGRNVAQKYADILHLSRPEPPVKYPRMALSNRAKIFSPFAALRGFDDEISSEGASKLLVKKVELSDDEKNTLSDKLLQVKKGMKVVVRYFMKTAESTGKYISLTGTVVMIDPVYRELKVMQDSDRKAMALRKSCRLSFPSVTSLNCPARASPISRTTLGLKNILMTYKFPHDKEVQNTVNYYFCDVCHYCFEAESLPDRCPDCGKTDYQNRPAIRPATEKEVQDLLRARDEEWE